MSILPDDFTGFIAIVKRDCATCRLIRGVLQELDELRQLIVYTQDDPAFPPAIADRRDDTELELSWHLDIEIVPTLLRVSDREEIDRLVGWGRADWRRLTDLPTLGDSLPEFSPGCGSKSVDPGHGGKTGIQIR